jgi:hypothetical protein
LPGGLLGDTTGVAPVANFTRDPSKPATLVILDEKNIEYSFDNTFSNISFMSVHRDTRLPILLSKAAEPNKLLFKKVFLRDEAALGDEASTRLQMEKVAKRVFYPTRKASFKTTGGLGSALPFDFLTVDDQEFRLLGITRSYEASTNDFVNTYNGEWLYGQ